METLMLHIDSAFRHYGSVVKKLMYPLSSERLLRFLTSLNKKSDYATW